MEKKPEKVDALSSLIEVKLKDQNSFLMIKETLERVGLVDKEKKILYQTCHILHKKGRYYIVHFKEMFLLNGRKNNMSDGDYERRNQIVKMLEQWNLLSPISAIEGGVRPVQVIPHTHKSEWKLVSKYTIGAKK